MAAEMIRTESKTINNMLTSIGVTGKSGLKEGRLISNYEGLKIG